MSSFIRRHVNEIAIFLIALVCYAYFFPRWADQSQNSRLNMVIAMVDDGTFRIDKYVANTTDYARVGDRYYSDKAPGAAFLGVPIYAGLKLMLGLPILDSLTDRLAGSEAFQSTLRSTGSGVYEDKVRYALALVVISFLLGAVSSAFLCVLLYRVARRFAGSALVGVVVALAYGLLTPAFAYANAFYGHQLSAAMLFGAFCLILSMSRPVLQLPAQSQTGAPSPIKLLLIGLLLGYSVVTEYPAFMIAAVLFFYALFVLWRADELKRIVWVIPGAVVCAAGLMAYNTALFGGPFTLGYSNSELWVKQHSTGFLSLTYPHFDALWGVTFGLFRGLFVLSPIMLLAVAGFLLWWRSRKYRAEFWVSLLGTLSFLLFNSSSIMWWGGFAIGPRYLLPALPFTSLALTFVFALTLGAGVRSTSSSARMLTLLCAVLAAWSFVATWGLTLAEQAFPPDTLFNPLAQHALPNWLAGNIARNLGTLLGFKGVASLLPLMALVALVGLGWWVAARKRAADRSIPLEAMKVGSEI